MTDYPYMYARVSAKRAKLLEKGDYESLLKMQPNEIARNLEEGDYRDEINELGAKYEGVELVELALNRNLSNTLSHLREIAPEKLKEVLDAYLRRYDLQSLKRLLRWKKGGEEIEIQDLLTPVGRYDQKTLEELAGKEFEEIVDAIDFPDSEIDYRDHLKGKEELSDIERALDRAYFEELELLSSKVGSPQFRRFIKEELEYENLRTALRLKKYGFSRDEIEPYLLASNGSQVVKNVLDSTDIDQALETVGEEKGIEAERLEDAEHELEAQRLQEALQMLHTEPLGVTSILGYIVAKIIEVKNLRMLIRAKDTGIQNRKTIRRNLVTA